MLSSVDSVTPHVFLLSPVVWDRRCLGLSSSSFTVVLVLYVKTCKNTVNEFARMTVASSSNTLSTKHTSLPNPSTLINFHSVKLEDFRFTVKHPALWSFNSPFQINSELYCLTELDFRGSQQRICTQLVKSETSQSNPTLHFQQSLTLSPLPFCQDGDNTWHKS